MTDAAEVSKTGNRKRKLYVACNACRFRKVKCDRESRLQQGHSACTRCETSSMECLLTVNPPKTRLGKRIKMLHEEQEASEPSSIDTPESATATKHDSLQACRAPLSNSTSSFQDALGMSPGLTGLLQTASEQQAARVHEEPALLSTATDGGNMLLYADDAHPHNCIIQNSMFAALDSNNANVFHLSTGNTPVNEAHHLIHQYQFDDSSTAAPDSASSEVAPMSATAADSDQSSPDVIGSKVTNGVSAQCNALKRRNPFDQPSLNLATGQVGFVGGLLGIASLDKHILDLCVRAYFESMGRCIGFIRPEWFWPRYHAFFSRYSGLYVEAISDPNEQPVSELLIIALACRGAGATQFANRFELQKDLFDHYRRLIKDQDRLVRDGFDALESVILMSEHADCEPKSIPDPMSAQGVYDVDILSHEGLIRLMKKLELHRDKPFGTRLEGRDAIRQRLLFWTIYVFDAIRAEGGRTMPLIEEHDISLAHTFPELATTTTDATPIAFSKYFVELSNICRYVAYNILSPQARRDGIEPRDLFRVLDDLEAWHDNLGPSLTWDWNDMLHITGPKHPEDQTRRSFLLFLFLGQWAALDLAVEEIGFSSTCDAKSKEEAKRRLEHEVQMALDRQVLVCDHGTLFGIIRLHPGMMQSWSLGWAFWCIKRMGGILKQKDEAMLARAKANQAFQRYQSAVVCFINAAASCDSVSQTPERVQQLMTALKGVIEARKSSSLAFKNV
ncbi:hypothetical protein EX895_001553 [Sporisorium graminicola]|uniref:Zn(2)-C6 fungal-type domain-containing protein n=1 Tax=Sporisorium graminicola TaxID=280036 RepID=A0A4U7L1C4_9BASI|nr:hypothetical protein EX895_001553 [Sporisorium graminicola]TKY89022.1 hypothetical protein EX895_001553 [Sporisorium graminicola]